jgi:hypothetical protein
VDRSVYRRCVDAGLRRLPVRGDDKDGARPLGKLPGQTFQEKARAGASVCGKVGAPCDTNRDGSIEPSWFAATDMMYAITHINSR